MAAEEMQRFGLTPKVALLSHSNFGSGRVAGGAEDAPRHASCSAKIAPDLEVEGEMQGDAALSEEIRLRVLPDSRLKGEANLLVMPNLDAANIAFNLLKVDRRRRHHRRPDPARRGEAGAHPDADARPCGASST